MRLVLSVAAAAALVIGCGSDSSSSGTGTTGGGGTSDAATTTGGGTSDAGTTTGGGTTDAGTTGGGTTTYTNDAQPIFAKYCSGCHSGAGQGGHNIATTYADSQKASAVCAGKNVGECAVERIKAKTMPPGGGVDATAAEITTLEAWLSDGALE